MSIQAIPRKKINQMSQPTATPHNSSQHLRGSSHVRAPATNCVSPVERARERESITPLYGPLKVRRARAFCPARIIFPITMRPVAMHPRTYTPKLRSRPSFFFTPAPLFRGSAGAAAASAASCFSLAQHSTGRGRGLLSVYNQCQVGPVTLSGFVLRRAEPANAALGLSGVRQASLTQIARGLRGPLRCCMKHSAEGGWDCARGWRICRGGFEEARGVAGRP